MVSIARAAAPMLPAWLVAHQHDADRVEARCASIADGRRRASAYNGASFPCASPAPRRAPPGVHNPTMHPMLSIAVKAARRAGNIINRGARDLDLLTVTTKGPKDFVSEVDRRRKARSSRRCSTPIRTTRF